eukprot:scaffold57229_cov55-Attheya_sp.AAC.2
MRPDPHIRDGIDKDALNVIEGTILFGANYGIQPAFATIVVPANGGAHEALEDGLVAPTKLLFGTVPRFGCKERPCRILVLNVGPCGALGTGTFCCCWNNNNNKKREKE